jgi:hypothetical protein
MQLTGKTRFQLVDEDGEDLPETWEFDWSGRDPFDIVVAAVTEVSGRPWKWSIRKVNSGKLSPQRCRVMSARVANVLRKENRGRAAESIARVASEEFTPRRKGKIDPQEVRAILAKIDPELPDDADERPEILAAVMLRRFRRALRTAVDVGAGLRVSWQVDE